MNSSIAQSFTITSQMCNNQSGLFLASVDLYFQSIDPKLGVTVSIVGMQNGFPTNVIRPLASKHLRPISTASQVTATSPDGTTSASTVYIQGGNSPVRSSTDGSIPSTFVFSDPVYLQANQDYALVISADGSSPNYTIWTATLGGTDQNALNGGTTVTNLLEGGYLFESTNGATWTPLSSEQLKFCISSANVLQPAGSVQYVNEDAEFLVVTPVSSSNLMVGSVAYQTTANVTNGVPATIYVNASSNSITFSSNVLYPAWPSYPVTTILAGINPSTGAYTQQYINVSSNTVNSSTITLNFTTTPTITNSAYSNVTLRVSPYSTTENLSFVSNGNVIFSSGTQYQSSLTVGSRIIVEGWANNQQYRSALTVGVVNTNTYATYVNPYTGSSSSNWFATVTCPTFSSNTYTGYMLPPRGIVQSQNSPVATSIYLANSTANTTNYFKPGYTLQDVWSGAAVTINAVNDIVVSRMQPLFHTDIPTGTNIQVAVNPYQGANYSYAASTSFVLNPSNYNYFGNNEVVIASRSNECSGALAGAKSFSANVILTTSSTQLTPQVLGPVSVTSYTNYVNANTYYENTKKGGALSRYITKTIQLAPGQIAEDVVVYVDAYWPANATISVYGKVMNPSDPDTFDSKDWSPLNLVSNNAGISSISNRNDIWSFQFGFANSVPGTQLPGYATVLTTSQALTFSNTNNYKMFVNGSIVQITSKGLTQVTVIANTNSSSYANLYSNASYSDTSATVKTATVPIPLNGTASISNSSYNITLSNTTNYSAFANGSLVQAVSGNIPQVLVVNVANSSFMNATSYASNTDTSASVYQVDQIYGAFNNQQNSGIVRYISKSGSVYDGYTTLALKIVLSSTNTWQVPRVKDVRAICLSV